MNKAEWRQYLMDNQTFHRLNEIQVRSYSLSLYSIEKVLSSSQIINDIPFFVNRRSTRLNAELIKASIWAWKKGYLELNTIHQAINEIETTLQHYNIETIPLTEDAVRASMRSFGYVLSSSMF